MRRELRVKDQVEIRRNMPCARRFRNTPCRKNRANRLVNKYRLPPLTKARWQWKLRIAKWLTLMFPISTFVVEDIKARTWKNARKWNVSFSPLGVGKQWFYAELEKIARVETKTGNDTYELRQLSELLKSKQKLSNKFEAHCVDSWVLANWCVGGHFKPDNTALIEVIPLEFHAKPVTPIATRSGSHPFEVWRHFECGIQTRFNRQTPKVWVLLRRWLARVAYEERPNSENN